MWVAVCAWQAPARASSSTAAVHGRAGDEFAVGDPHLVHDQALHRALHVEHLEAQAVTGDQAGVGVLAAGLGVERGLVEHDLDHVARGVPGRRAGRRR